MNKKIWVASVSMFLMVTSVSLHAQSSGKTAGSDSVCISRDSLEKMTNEQLRAYCDSIYWSRYPKLQIVQRQDTSKITVHPERQQNTFSYSNSYVPNSVTVNTSKAVGQIDIQSGTSPTGAKSYTVPIKGYQLEGVFCPDISLSYNSQGGNCGYGKGWSVGGLQSITRVNKSIYYDEKTDGIKMNADDAFCLNGVRLVRISASAYEYETEQGRIKAVATVDGSVIKYFNVYYPNGYTAVFGMTSTATNKLEYPITSLTDTRGRSISFNYTTVNSNYFISYITYDEGSARISFTYDQSRPDYKVGYRGGLLLDSRYLLKSVSCTRNNSEIGVYTLTYSTDNSTPLLTQIDFSANNSSLNPLRFYYGDNSAIQGYYTSTAKLTQGYIFSNRSQMVATRGRFDYFTSNEGILFYPNGNPYYYVYNGSNNYYVNHYNSDYLCFAYNELNSNTVNNSYSLTLGNGFVTMLTADLDGDQHESIIQVNNYVSSNSDVLTFKIYKKAATGFHLQHTRYYYSSIYTDGNGNKSVRPKLFYTGDFNGDGRMEVMVMTTDNPFGETGNTSTCYIYDLVNYTTLYSGHIFNFNKVFESANMNSFDAEANSEKVIPLDYDGDGKTDLCHINANSTDLYTFVQNGNTLTVQQVGVNTDMRAGHFSRCFYSTGDFNGDGLMDIVASHQIGGMGSSIWKFYFSKGNGVFEYDVSGNGPSTGNTTSEFLVQDIDGDGITDIVEVNDNSFVGYMVKNNGITAGATQAIPYTQGYLAPVNINSSTLTTQFVCLYDTTATLYSYKTNRRHDQALTGMANSNGVVEKNYYYTINSISGIFTKGFGAPPLYNNIFEAITVLAGNEIFKNGTSIDLNKYYYYNGVVHRKGLGFRGFERVEMRNNRDQSTKTTYEPYNYSQLKEVESPTSKVTCSNSVTVDSYKRLKALVTTKVETDYLRNVTGTTDYTYDQYGQVLTESLSLPGNISVDKVYTYHDFTDISSKYHLGLLTTATTTTTRGNSQYSEQVQVTRYNSYDQPSTIKNKVNGNTVRTTAMSYDTSGNLTSKKITPYSSSTQRIFTYQYSSGNRLTMETSPVGIWKSYSYNTDGTISSVGSTVGTTNFTYDALGRVTSESRPDGTVMNTAFSWDSSNGGLYAVTKSGTNIPTETTVYDALNLDVRHVQTRFDGNLLKVDKTYDSYGNLKRESYPYKTGNPTYKEYSYDDNHRLTGSSEAGRIISYSYDGLSTTVSDGTMSTTTTEDALGGIVSVTDPAGTITYTLNGAGNPTSISAPGGTNGIGTTIGYDAYERRTSITDPSHGTTTYAYHSTKGYLQQETNAKNQTTSYVYDIYGRMTQKTCPEFYTTYTYDNNLNKITAETCSNGTSTSYSYDALGRLSSTTEYAVDSKWLQKEYTYTNGRVSAIKYTSQNGVLTTENHYYTNGHLTSVKLNGTTDIFNLTGEDYQGRVSYLGTGNTSRYYNYTVSGFPTSRVATVSGLTKQCIQYSFDNQTDNLESRSYPMVNKTETFSYDNLHRLTGFGNYNVVYDNNGNITTKSDVGSFSYNTSGKPYAVSDVTLTNNINVGTQNVSYYSFDRPNEISDNGYTASFTYNGNCDRVKMQMLHNSSASLTRYYLGGCYELDVKPSGNTEKLYLMGGYYDAPAVLIKQGGSSSVYYVLRDHLGSVTHVLNSSGTVMQELSYDAWGRLRNPSTWSLYTPTNEPEPYLGRGYCGHEHLTGLGLINMNARLYDPMLGRFLSPDPYVQAPDHTQSFNRYSYCLNNPLKYKDENGEWFMGTIFAAVTDFIAGIAKHGFNISQFNWTKTTNAWKIDIGMIKGNFGQVLNKWTWSYPLSLSGKEIAHALNMAGSVRSVTNMDGMLALSGVTKGTSAFTIGHYSFGPENYTATWKDHLFVHEYGHYIQGQIYGGLFIPLIGGPSLMSAMGIGGPQHDKRWFEVDASKKGGKYFDKLYGQGKKGYVKNSKDYFDITSFQNKGKSPYVNPRTGTLYQDTANPIHGSEHSIWDYLSPLVTLLVL